MTAGRSIITWSQSWGTPEKYVKAVKEMFSWEIDLDPCSNEFSIVYAKTEYCLPKNDWLRESWNFPRIYVNPPYGIDMERWTRIRDWLEMCAQANENYKSEVLALIPVATNTSHWKKCIFTKASAICFLYDTRLRFLENGQDTWKGAPMSCAMIYWWERVSNFERVFSEHGAVVDIRNLKGKKFGLEKNELSLF